MFPEFTRNAHVRDAEVPSGSIKLLAGNVSERKVSETRVVENNETYAVPDTLSLFKSCFFFRYK